MRFPHGVHHFGAVASMLSDQYRYDQYHAAGARPEKFGRDSVEMPRSLIEKKVKMFGDAEIVKRPDLICVCFTSVMEAMVQLSRRYNHRTDEFGGSLENRARYP